jgi:hypothetical protein
MGLWMMITLHVGKQAVKLTVIFHDLSTEINIYPQISPPYPQKKGKPAIHIYSRSEEGESA